MLTVLLALIDTPEEKKRFDELYYQYERLLYFIAKQRLGDIHLAEDAVNETLIRVIRHFDGIDEIDSPRTRRYLIVILKNVCADIYKKQKRQPDYPAGDNLEFIADAEAFGPPSTQDLFFQKYEVEMIQAALKTLPEDYQTVLYLSVAAGKSREEIAELTDTNIETIKKRLYRARKKLRETLETKNES